ncbi:MAG: Hsp20/alpha crystallin family protein, partial [Actinobacteria bacterium]|nr:Hsp20/alpha crystallin family protein [Actinomycetota bacterium]
MSKAIERTQQRSTVTDAPLPTLTRWGWRLPEFIDWPDRRTLRIEESRDDGTLTIRAEMPGIDPKNDVDLVVNNGILTISAERREKHEDTTAGTFRSEFRYGSFMRQVELPAECAPEDIEATYDNGILEVRVPVDGEEPHATHIE